MRVGRYVPAGSPLHRAPAAAKVAGLAAGALAVALCPEPAGPVLAAAGVALLARVSRVGVRNALAPVWGLRWFLLAVVALNGLFYGGGDALFSLGPVRAGAAGVCRGLSVAARTALVAVLGQLLVATTRPQEIVGGVRALLAPLGRLGVRTEPAALAVGVTVQLVPTLLREARDIMAAQALRRPAASARGPRAIIERLAEFARILVPIFVAAFRRADELALAMEARGYRIEPPCGRARRKERV